MGELGLREISQAGQTKAGPLSLCQVPFARLCLLHLLELGKEVTGYRGQGREDYIQQQELNFPSFCFAFKAAKLFVQMKLYIVSP